MNYMKKSMVLAALFLSILICGGCGATLNNSHYAYTPAEKISSGAPPLPVTVTINQLDDVRGNERKDNSSFAYWPLVLYANSHFDRPETERNFAAKGLKPSEDFANALMQELKQNRLFSEVSLQSKDDRKEADLIVTGRINRASVDTKVITYGTTMFSIFPWIFGLPEGKLYNGLDIRYEMRRARDNEIVWKCDVKGDWSRLFGFYYNYSDDEPYTGMNEILRKDLRNGLALLAEEIKRRPLEYWK